MGDGHKVSHPRLDDKFICTCKFDVFVAALCGRNNKHSRLLFPTRTSTIDNGNLGSSRIQGESIPTCFFTSRSLLSTTRHTTPTTTQALLRTTSQRLGQLQERKDSQGQLARRDIAAYLSQGHLALARAKAATLIQEDVMGDLLEELEMLVGVVGGHIGELGGVVGLGLREDVNGEGEVVKAEEREGERGGRVR